MFLITGYPKTGNTWLHVMFSYILNPNKMINGTAEPPDNQMFSHCMPGFNRESYPNISITVPGGLPGKRIILLIRHPGDTLVSLYMHNVYREQFPMYYGTIDEMVYDKIYGIKKLVVYYEWWWKYRDIPDIIYLIRYEDLLKNTYQIFLAALNAIKIIVPEQTIRDAVEFGNFENMQILEETNHLDWPTLWSKVYWPRQRVKNSLKVREGKIGNYRKILKPETVEYIDKYVAENLRQEYGYI